MSLWTFFSNATTCPYGLFLSNATTCPYGLFYLMPPHVLMDFFHPMPPHVLMDFVVFPPGHGSSVTDAHEAQLRCPHDVSGDIGGWSARRALKPKFY
jgi:hypothetical protein